VNPPFRALRPPPELGFAEVMDAPGLASYRDVLADGFGEGTREAEWVHAVFTRLGLGGLRWRHLVAYRGVEPVACGSLFMPDRVAGIYFVATRPAWRRQGIGTFVTSWLVQRASAAGATHVALSSSRDGFNVYRRLGFREVFRYQLWERAADTNSGGRERPLGAR
jgi:GNAT superfamily N-acetyltransferase